MIRAVLGFCQKTTQIITGILHIVLNRIYISLFYIKTFRANIHKIDCCHIVIRHITSNADYDKVGDEIHRLRDQKQKLLLENANRDELKKRIADMSTFLKKQSTALTEYDKQLVRRLIDKVTVFEDKFTVEFKSGVTVDVDE